LVVPKLGGDDRMSPFPGSRGSDSARISPKAFAAIAVTSLTSKNRAAQRIFT